MAEQLAKTSALESHEKYPADGNMRLEHQLVLVGVTKDLHETKILESTNNAGNKKLELAKAKKALCVLESRACAKKTAMHSTIEGHDSVEGELVTPLAKLQVGKGSHCIVSSPYSTLQ